MTSNEIYFGTANNIDELLTILRRKAYVFATIKVASKEHSSGCEVWYDADAEVVILK